MNGASPLNNPSPRLRVSALCAMGVLALGLGLLVYAADWSWLPLPEAPASAFPTGESRQEGPRLPGDYTKDATHYPGIGVAAVVPTAPPPAVPPSRTPLASFTLPSLPPPGASGATQGLGVGQEKGGRATGSTTTQGASAPRKKPRWEYLAQGEQEGVGVPPGSQGLVSTEGMPGVVARGQPQQTQGRLIKPATWEIPAHPLKTLYRSQEIQGELLHPVHSDLPGQLHIRTTIPTFDKFGYGTILLDKGSLIIAVQTGQPQYGQSRLKIVLEQIELPTGEVMALKASIDEQDGSSGLAGKVNNHYGKLLLATGISALLNIGVRSAAGTPGAQQFFRNPVQDAAQDVGQGVQQEAQKAVDRELRVPPTIERKAYTFCTIHLQQNIQFNRPPVVAR